MAYAFSLFPSLSLNFLSSHVHIARFLSMLSLLIRQCPNTLFQIFVHSLAITSLSINTISLKTAPFNKFPVPAHAVIFIDDQ